MLYPIKLKVLCYELFVQELDKKVREQINKLFTEDSKSVVYLANHEAEVKQGEVFGVAFAFRNLETGTTEAAEFTYQVKTAGLSDSCRGLTPERADGWIQSRESGEVNLPPGETHYTIVRFQIPEDAPLCIVPYDVEIKKDGNVYTTDFFDLVIKS